MIKIDQAFINEMLIGELALDIVDDNGSYSTWSGSAYVSTLGVYAPTLDQAYLEIKTFPAGTSSFSFNTDNDSVGLYQCIVRYPSDVGGIIAKTKAEEVLSLFKVGTTISYDGQTINILSSSRDGGRNEGGYYQIVVRVNYRAFVDKITYVLYDKFTGVDGTPIQYHTPDIGNFTYTGTASLLGNQLVSTSGTQDAVFDVGIVPKVTTLSVVTNAVSQVVVVIRKMDASNKYLCAITTGGVIQIFERTTASGFIQRANLSTGANTGVFEVEDTGSIIYVRFNGFEVSYATTLFNTYSEAEVNLAGTGTAIDDLSVRAL